MILLPPISTLFPYTTLFRSEIALCERASWVIESLATWRADNRETLPTEWRAGAPLLYQGRPLTLALFPARREDRKSTRLNSSHMSISYAVFCLKKKTKD